MDYALSIGMVPWTVLDFHISRTDTGTVVDWRVFVVLVLGHYWTVSHQ